MNHFLNILAFAISGARGRKANTGASLVYRWRPKGRRQQQHIQVEPSSGRSRKDERIGAAGWLWMGRWKLVRGHCQEASTQVQRVNFKNIFFAVSQHCLVLAMMGIRSDNIPPGSCSHGVFIMPKAGRTRNLAREAGLPDPWTSRPTPATVWSSISASQVKGALQFFGVHLS